MQIAGLRRYIFVATVFSACLFAGELVAQTCATQVGVLASREGVVEVQRTGSRTWQQPPLNAAMCQGDTLRVGGHSRAAIALINDAVLRLDQNTTMRLTNVVREPEKRSVLSLITGVFQSFSRKPRRLQVNTAYLNGSIEGTEFVLERRGDKAVLTVLEGTVIAANQRGRVSVTGGQLAEGTATTAPVKRIVARPRDAVQWALYYPPVLAGAGNAASPAGRAAALLNVGRVDEARAEIDRAIAGNTNAALAYALRAVINVVQNRTDEAYRDAQQAVRRAPQSAAAKVALSYAQQARFDLPAARDSMLAAVKAEPRNALAWARLAELQLSLGNRDASSDAAVHAVELAPDIARPRTVLGFAALAELDIDEAAKSFEEAIKLSSSAPLPRLGLGLAKIKRGDLEVGRREIEIAVGLDSDNALLRSYLGKAYFDEKRPPLDAQQLAIAKKLDPKDPTPWLYDAIRKQTENQPVEALKDLQESIAKNDNRAVYRGRLQLDQDRAARGASLARIYDDLGFPSQGALEASKSLTLDPGNASAHRFLSDNYKSVRRREISRVSELLQAQMLQDVNINPVQPSVASANLSMPGSDSPFKAGFNEYTALFDRNSIRLDLSGAYGSNDTWSSEGVVSALVGRFSFSGGAVRSRTNGFRENDELLHDVINFFGQAALTQDLNVQFEWRKRNSRSGDLKMDFDPDRFDPEFDRDIGKTTGRLGVRYSPTPKTNLLFSYVNVERNEDTFQFTSNGTQFREGDADERGDQWEAQYQLTTQVAKIIPRLNVIAGGGHTRDNRTELVVDKRAVAFAGFPPGCNPALPFPLGCAVPPIPVGTPVATITNTKERITHDRGYVYVNANVPSSVTWTLAATYEDFDRSTLTINKWNPKFGVQWDVGHGLRLRAAAYKVLKPVLLSNQTLEPTQIAGFNQLFDDVNATRSTGYALGADFQVSNDVFLGAEASIREYEEPINVGGGNFSSEGRDEAFYRILANWTPLSELAVSGEVSLDHYNAGSVLLGGLPLRVDTYSLPVGIRYFSTTGLFANFGVTLVHQEVDRKDTSTLAQGRDTFAVADAGIGYRLPNRLGLVSLQVANIFNSSFKYQDDSFREFRDNPTSGPYTPERTILFRAALRY